jgi:2-polyprenyl-6-methoxyphenol hydroxylase-like FAD-dependent oxidoreductase
MTNRDMGSAIIVGGSLAGLAGSIVLARQGIAVTVLERATGTPPPGSGLWADFGLLRRVTGCVPEGLGIPVPGSPWHAVSWRGLRDWMYDAAAGLADVRPGVEVRDIGQDAAGAWAVSSAGETFRADVVFGADGHRSTIRRLVAPDHPAATYAGYLIWRGLTDGPAVPLRGNDGVIVDHCDGYYLVAYLVPGPGRRQLAWAWYDAGRDSLLEAAGCVSGREVLGSLSADQVPGDVLGELARSARRCWPSPWSQAIVLSLQRQEAIGTPIPEYEPRRLVDGRIGLLGDAAHAASPMTGRGFHTTLLDVEALAAVARRGVAGLDASRVLGEYERIRIEPGRSLVRSGRSWGRQYLRETGKAATA